MPNGDIFNTVRHILVIYKEGEPMEIQFYDASDIAKILGCCQTHARTLMMQMPHFRASQTRRSPYRVRIEDFNEYIRMHTINPDELQPRTSPYETKAQIVERETREWQKERREA